MTRSYTGNSARTRGEEGYKWLNLQKGVSRVSLRRLDEEPRQSVHEREVASASTMAQQRRRTHDPAICAPLAHLSGCQQTVRSRLGQATWYLTHLASEAGSGIQEGSKQGAPNRGIWVSHARATRSRAGTHPKDEGTRGVTFARRANGARLRAFPLDTR